MKNLRDRFNASKTKITGLTPTGRKSAIVEFETYDSDGQLMKSGKAACFDIDSVEIDDEDYLVGEARLTSTGEFISVPTAFDRTGLGYK